MTPRCLLRVSGKCVVVKGLGSPFTQVLQRTWRAMKVWNSAFPSFFLSAYTFSGEIVLVYVHGKNPTAAYSIILYLLCRQWWASGAIWRQKMFSTVGVDSHWKLIGGKGKPSHQTWNFPNLADIRQKFCGHQSSKSQIAYLPIPGRASPFLIATGIPALTLYWDSTYLIFSSALLNEARISPSAFFLWIMKLCM